MNDDEAITMLVTDGLVRFVQEPGMPPDMKPLRVVRWTDAGLDARTDLYRASGWQKLGSPELLTIRQYARIRAAILRHVHQKGPADESTGSA